jgi:hypothetical protein
MNTPFNGDTDFDSNQSSYSNLNPIYQQQQKLIYSQQMNQRGSNSRVSPQSSGQRGAGNFTYTYGKQQQHTPKNKLGVNSFRESV